MEFLKQKKENGMINKNNKSCDTPILSICIPTWNRSKYLKSSLELVNKQLDCIKPGCIEILVSDNASDDNTKDVIQELAKKGMSINYDRNTTNIGASENCLKCINWAKGKYIWLLGDDDFLLPGTLVTILTILEHNDYGLVHLKTQSRRKGFEIYTDHEIFFKEISYWITFLSGNIFSRDVIKEVKNPENYISSCLIQLPYYIYSALMKNENVIVFTKTMLDGRDTQHNGGYNFFKVFVNNYLTIWEFFLENKLISSTLYQYLKKDIFIKFIAPNMFTLLIRRKKINNHSEEIYSRQGFLTDNGWHLLFRYFGRTCYFYLYSFFSFSKWIIKGSIRKIQTLLS